MLGGMSGSVGRENDFGCRDWKAGSGYEGIEPSLELAHAMRAPRMLDDTQIKCSSKPIIGLERTEPMTERRDGAFVATTLPRCDQVEGDTHCMGEKS